jgi:hypothetical protein
MIFRAERPRPTRPLATRPVPPARHCARSAAVQAEHSTERGGMGKPISVSVIAAAPCLSDDRPDGAGSVSAVPLGERSGPKARGHAARRGTGCGTTYELV